MTDRYIGASAILAASSLLSITTYVVAVTAYADAILPALALVAMVLGLAFSCLLALWYCLSE